MPPVDPATNPVTDLDVDFTIEPYSTFVSTPFDWHLADEADIFLDVGIEQEPPVNVLMRMQIAPYEAGPWVWDTVFDDRRTADTSRVVSRVPIAGEFARVVLITQEHGISGSTKLVLITR